MSEQDWFSDEAIRNRYRYWLMARDEDGTVCFVPFEKGADGEWWALPLFARYIPLDDVKPLADVIWSVKDWRSRPWTLTPIYESYEGATAVSGYKSYTQKKVRAEEGLALGWR